MRARPASVICGICVVRAAVAALSAVPAAAAVPAAPAPTSAVALAAGATGSDEVFYRGDDGSVRLRTHRDGVWSGETSLGGRIVGAPAAAVAGDAVVVVGRGSDDAAWSRTRTQGVWGGWQRIGGGLSAAPAVAAGPGGVDAPVCGADDGLWTAGLAAGGKWSAWTSLGGRLSAGPAAVGTAAGTLEAYATLADHSLARRTRTGTTWSGWEPLGGLTVLGLAAAQQLPGSATVIAVRGTNNALYLSAGTGGWEQLGGVPRRARARRGRGRPRPDGPRHGPRDLDAPAAAAVRVVGLEQGVDADRPAAATRRPAGTDWTRSPRAPGSWRSPSMPAPTPTASGRSAPRWIAMRCQATFFLTGQFAGGFPDGRRAWPPRASVGNHTMTHPHLPTLSDAADRERSSDPAEAIRRPLAQDPGRCFRFPFGDRDARTIATVNGARYVPFRWTVDTLGWKGTSGGQTAARSSTACHGRPPGRDRAHARRLQPRRRHHPRRRRPPEIIARVRAMGYGP